MVAVLVLGPETQPLLVGFLFLLFVSLSLPRTPSPAMSHSHFASPGLGDGGTWYCVLWWLLYNVSCAGFQSPFETTSFVSSGAGPPLAPLAYLTTLSTLHGVLQGSEALWTLVKATALVQVKTRVALRAEVFAETGFTVIYPTPGAHVDVCPSHAVESRRTGVETLAVLPHPLPPQEQEELGLAVHTAVIL